ncbi:uncharacterized protein BP5553_10383 [Venustampulla echinocandica]|uniref:Asl1-like glycosyl hydrolase catalytic domain-containing protein n=1 Tax=Venustampulla echinocandica TaxID=2656787 RepID=A0A370T958_9HELO|nr:uncharacterized protein BP5553_10383 [Venustampulla echinocandica]RDL30105.1 hypothetical protein BP5553_10383 [Venustampulla echinocandica]
MLSLIPVVLKLAGLLLGLLTVQAEAAVGKRGVPFNDPPTWIQCWGGSKVSWAHNWGSRMPDGFPGNLEFIPMLWGLDGAHVDGWVNNANNALSRGSGHLIAFNEPDACDWGQSCISPKDAADGYRQHMAPFRGRASLGSPAITNRDQNLTWLKDFMRLCSDCPIDFITVHWYDHANNFAYFTWYMNQVHSISGGRYIWITEFNAAGTTDEQINFLNQALPWLDSTIWIQSYAWFWTDPLFQGGSLVNWAGRPTALGGEYGWH